MARNDRFSEPLLAGVIKRPITPTVKRRKVFIAGHRGGRLALNIHDELWVRVLSLRFGDVTLVLAELDLVGLLHGDVQYVRERAIEAGLPAQNLIITCTYNHSGPDTIGLWSKGALGSGLNVRYLNFLREELVQVIALAVSMMVPVEAYFARSEIPDPVAGAELKELEVLQLKTPEGKGIATLVNYPLVPQILEKSNTSISADFPNWLCQELEGSRDEIALYVCADANTGSASAIRDRSWDEAERVGRELATAVRETLKGVPPTQIERLNIWQRPIVIPTEDPVARWLKRAGVLQSHRLAEWRADSQVGLIQLGPARLAVLPGLVAPELGFEIRKLLDAPYRFLLCVSNDNLGSIMPPPSPASYAVVEGRIGRAGHDVSNDSYVGTIILDELADLMLASRREQGE
jgi:hypothetical protein